jgi:peptide/nickel transport system substrate-binding protein
MSLFRDRSRSIFGRFSRGKGRRSSASLREQSGWDKRLVHSLTSARLPTWRQIRHLPEVLSSNDSFRLRLGSILFAAGLVLLGVRYYYAHTEIGPSVGGEISEAVVGTPRSLNPILSVSNDVDNDLTRLLFSRLFTTDGAGRVVPDLVEDYDISADQKTYTFTLRDNARWHDGEPLTTDDVIFTLALIQDPAWKSPLLPLLKDVKFEKSGERTIVLTLAEPYAQFLSRLNFGILPRHVWKDVTPQDSAMAEASLKPIGSGPFKYSDMRRDKRGFVLSYVIERNADYYKEAPYLEKLSFHFYPDYPTALEALRKRQVQSLSFVPRDMRGEVSGLSHVIPVSLELPQVTAVFFNARNNEELKEKDVRRALTMAIDKVRILFDVLGGDGHPIDRPALPGMSATSTSPVPFRIDEAGALLDGLGWKIDPEDGLRKKDVDKDPKTDMKTLSVALTTVDQPENLNVASIIRNGWAALGVEATVNAVPASEIHRTVIKPREYEALLYGQLMGTDPDLYPFWHSSQIQDPGLNLAMFANDDADDALEDARRTADPAARQEAYRKFLAVLAEEVPAAFLYSPSYTYPMSAELKGFTGTRVASPSDRFATVTSWYLETARVWKK